MIFHRLLHDFALLRSKPLFQLLIPYQKLGGSAFMVLPAVPDSQIVQAAIVYTILISTSSCCASSRLLEMTRLICSGPWAPSTASYCGRISC